MGTYTIDLADLQELIRGNPVAVGPVWVTLDASQLDAALKALVPLSLRDPDHTKIGVELLHDVGIDLDIVHLRYITLADSTKRSTAAIHIEDRPFTDVSHTRCGRQFYTTEVFDVGDPVDAYGPMCQRCLSTHDEKMR